MIVFVRYVQSHSYIIVSAIVVFLCIIFFPVYQLINFHVPYQIELEKCPSCLGRNMCDCFINNKFRLNWDHFWTNLLNIILKKTIIFGSCGSQMVVLKWVKDRKHFKVKTSNILLNNMEENVNLDQILQSMRSLLLLNHTDFKDFILCPSSEKLGFFLKPITDLNGRNSTTKMELYHNLFYSLQVNMGPLIQQIINDWAVARYLGACGDISVSEYCGHTLTSVFPKLSWIQRSSIARQLLIFALNATFSNPAFAFYFTDLSPDNFAVSDSNEIRLVDLDNVIAVDKDPSDVPDSWDTVHINYHEKNIRGFAFSTKEICSHRISDINVYAICQGILSVNSDLLPGGLLHSAPPYMTDLKELVEDCIFAPTGQSRFDLAQSILQVLGGMSDG